MLALITNIHSSGRYDPISVNIERGPTNQACQKTTDWVTVKGHCGVSFPSRWQPGQLEGLSCGDIRISQGRSSL